MNLDISRKSIINFSLLCLLSLLFLFQGKGVLAYNNVYRDLVDKGVATYEDGCRAISCFADVDEKNLTFDELVSALKEKGIIGKRWKYKAEKPVTRGIMAYMVCRALNIKGGLTMRTINTTKRFTRLIYSKLGIKGDFGLPDIGVGKRYAYLELQNMGLVPAGHKKTFLTGHDLLALMYRVEQYIKAEERGEKEKQENQKKSGSDKDKE